MSRPLPPPPAGNLPPPPEPAAAPRSAPPAAEPAAAPAAAAPAPSPLPPLPSAALAGPPKRASRGLLLVAVALACVAALLAYYSVTLWQRQQSDQVALETTRKQVSELQSEQVKTQKQAVAREQRLATADEELATTRAALADAQARLSTLEEQQADADAQMKEFREMAALFQRMIDSGKLKVIMRRGRMVVDLPAQVLFPSGSADLSDEGKRSLREVARILRGVRGKRFIVAGHTDNMKLVRGAPFTSNWALSAARAVTVTETLVRAGLKAEHLVAAGYGPHDPVASNRNEDGRQQNRRMEIILEPKLRELPEVAAK